MSLVHHLYFDVLDHGRLDYNGIRWNETDG